MAAIPSIADGRVRCSAAPTANRLLSVGGFNTVRGYRENQLVRDQGEYLNLEFDYPQQRNPSTGLSWNLIPFLDYGRAHNRDQAHATLSSVGLASRLIWRGLQLDLALARRIHADVEPNAKSNTLQDRGVHLQASYKF